SLRSWMYSSSRFASSGASAGVASSRATAAGSVPTSAGAGGAGRAKTGCRSGAGLRGFRLTIARRRARDEGIEELAGCPGHVVHGAIERRLVGSGRLAESTQLADELERGRTDLLGGGRRFEVV